MSGHRLGADVFRLQGRKSAWAVPLLLALAVVLVAALAFNVANLDPGRETIPQAPAAGGPSPTESYLPDPIVTQVLAVLFGFVMLGGAILFVRNRPGGDPGDRGRRRSALGDPRLLPAVLRAPRVPRHHEAGSADPSRARAAGRRPLARLAGRLGDLDLPVRGGAVQRAPARRP